MMFSGDERMRGYVISMFEREKELDARCYGEMGRALMREDCVRICWLSGVLLCRDKYDVKRKVKREL